MTSAPAGTSAFFDNTPASQPRCPKCSRDQLYRGLESCAIVKRKTSLDNCFLQIECLEAGNIY